MKVILTIALLLCCMATLDAQSERSHLRDGNSAYTKGKFSDAEISYRKALEKDKDVRQGPFNLGDALYKEGRFAEAQEQYRIAATKENDPEVKAQALHNLGNAFLNEKKLAESIGAYKESLRLNPRDADTKYNLEYAKAMLQQQKQQQQQKNDDKKDQQKQKQSQQNQQKEDQQKKQQEQQQQQQQQDEKKQQQQAQQKKQQISKADAERILEALKNEERDVQKKLKKKVPARIQVEKDW